MDVHIGEVKSDVLPVDDRSRLEGEELDRIVDATLARLEQRQRSDERARDDTRLWGSVRAGSGR
jgi:hypothetical protein